MAIVSKCRLRLPLKNEFTKQLKLIELTQLVQSISYFVLSKPIGLGLKRYLIGDRLIEPV
jgi:hypothetical protein